MPRVTMKMARGRADHGVWRELIAARLDRPLTRSETRTLAAHLRDCAACREAERDYRDQHALLQALPQRPVPRDLWPRTSAALDREVARGSYRGVRVWRGVSRRGSAPSATIATTLAALGLIAAVGMMQLMPALSVTPAPALAQGTPGQPTPFAVAPQALAWVGTESADLYVYQTHVGHVCPPNAETCAVDDSVVRTQVNLPASVHARNLALSPTGKALALVGRDRNHDVIAVVMLSPSDGNPPSPAPPASLGPGETPDGQPTDLPEPTISAPPASAVAGLQVLAIVENVESAGAQPAWSPSGATLAFSARPADGSHGPDVYVWSPSDAVAQPITSDHSSYFASWSGEHIVLSRVAAQGDDGAPQLSTFVIDPDTLDERPVAGPPLWLPVVNPAGTKAVAWQGELDLSAGLAVPRTGDLVMVDWSAIDPYVPGNEPPTTPTPTDSPAPTVPPTDSPTSTPDASAPATTSPAPASPSAAPASASAAPAFPSASPSAAPAAPSDAPTASPSDEPVTPDATSQPTALPAGWTDLDLERDASDAPIVDWQARWSLDGHVLGIWIADAEDTTWGRLIVLGVDPNTGQVAAGDPLLKPTLARRGFSLGLSRVAWVAPSDDNPDGELRVRTWGDDGVGGLRLLPAQLEEVVPAF